MSINSVNVEKIFKEIVWELSEQDFCELLQVFTQQVEEKGIKAVVLWNLPKFARSKKFHLKAFIPPSM